MGDNIAHVHSTRRAVELLLQRNLYSFSEGSIVGKGMFYKKGHRVKNWKNRSWVVNDFSTAREMPDDRQGQFRYYKPQEAADYDRDTSRDTVSNMLGLNSDQKTIKLEAVYFEKGPAQNIKDSECIYQNTAFPLNVTFTNKDDSLINTIAFQKEETFKYELVFAYKDMAEDFIRSLYQASKRTPNLSKFIDDNKLNRRNILRSPRLTFEPSFQTSLGCLKLAPYCVYPDCIGWGSYCACCCAEMYSQGGLVFDLIQPISQQGHLAAPIFAQCCVMESIVCECRMIRACVCKTEQQVCCVDLRFAFPTDADVPLELGLCGCKLCGAKPRGVISSELMPLTGGSDEIPKETLTDEVRNMIGGNQMHL
jgi:DNA-binding phage protein